MKLYFYGFFLLILNSFTVVCDIINFDNYEVNYPLLRSTSTLSTTLRDSFSLIELITIPLTNLSILALIWASFLTIIPHLTTKTLFTFILSKVEPSRTLTLFHRIRLYSVLNIDLLFWKWRSYLWRVLPIFQL